MANEATFEGTVHTLNALNPGVIVSKGVKQHFPTFRVENSHEGFGFDPNSWMDEGLIDSLVMGIIAKKRHGKTSVDQILTETLLKRRAVNGQRYKVSVDDLRRNFDHGEWYKAARLNKVDEVPLRSYHLTPFDPLFELDFGTTLGIGQFMLEYSIGRKFDIDETEALRCGMWYMFTEAHAHMSMPTLAFICRRMETGDFKALSQQVVTQVSTDLLGNRWVSRQLTNDTRDLVTAAHRVASVVEEFVIGKFGAAFGGKQSMALAMQQPLFVRDFANLSDEIIMLMQTWMWRIKRHALVNTDQRFFFNMEIHDENYRMWRYLPYALEMSDYMKQNRGNGTFLVLSTHRLRDYYTVGDAGSQQRELATNMTSDVEMWLLGRQDKVGAREVAERFDLSGTEEEMIRTRPRGHWLLKIGDRPAIPVYLKPTQQQLLLIESDKANKAMLTDN